MTTKVRKITQHAKNYIRNPPDVTLSYLTESG